MNWRDYIQSNPNILSGKPTIIGTRLGVEFLLELLASGFSETDLLENYPQLSTEALRAVFAFSAECIRDEAATLALTSPAA